MVWHYQTEILARCETLNKGELPDVTRLAMLPQNVRGFGPVKDKNMDALYAEWRVLQAQATAPCGSEINQVS